jgi:hypothetical protein
MTTVSGKPMMRSADHQTSQRSRVLEEHRDLFLDGSRHEIATAQAEALRGGMRVPVIVAGLGIPCPYHIIGETGLQPYLERGDKEDCKACFSGYEETFSS